MIRCMNCQQSMKLDASLTERYPEWQTLAASRGRGASMASRSKSTSSEPTTSGSSEGNLGHFMAMQGNLFDIICSDATPIDHPMCQECTDKLLDCMDQQLKQMEEECGDYQKVVADFDDSHSHLDMDSLRLELVKLQSEESALRTELARLETEEHDIDRQLLVEKKDAERVAKEEERLWKVYRDHSRHILDLELEDKSVQSQLRYTTEQLDKLSKTNIFNLTFHIWHSGHFGIINGFRLGRMPDEEVEWNEINAAWGQTVLLLHSLAKKLTLSFQRFELVPFGNSSSIRCLDVANPKDRDLPLYYTGGHKFLGNSKFDAAMMAFLDCLQQLQEKLGKSGGFQLPYAMLKDKILENGREYSVKIQFNSEERWTKAMKFLLTNLKWALAWIASLHS